MQTRAHGHKRSYFAKSPSKNGIFTMISPIGVLVNPWPSNHTQLRSLSIRNHVVPCSSLRQRSLAPGTKHLLIPQRVSSGELAVDAPTPHKLSDTTAMSKPYYSRDTERSTGSLPRWPRNPAPRELLRALSFIVNGHPGERPCFFHENHDAVTIPAS